ncbi:hypothetical protein VNI00_002259 [Paramarasmius palmivorus]|uniref:DRBM domain-containing protein n=1 Tax=Paramarasmius palmivorus TaxID=297713 RepID=A0AAW0E6E6_9AGAR
MLCNLPRLLALSENHQDLQGIGRLDALVWNHSTSGPAHSPTWTCIAKIDGRPLGMGTGPRKYIAMDMAAEQALQAMKEEA